MNDRETWLRLLHWQKGQADSERLAADILCLEEFQSIDPAHPLGGPDGLKDIVMEKNGVRWIAAAHFPNGDKGFRSVEKKFVADFAGVAANNAKGFAFVTNQPLHIKSKSTLEDHATNCLCEIYDLERLRVILDSFSGVRIRERYLDIPATSADLLAAVGTLSDSPQLMNAQGGSFEKVVQDVLLNVPHSGKLSFAQLIDLAQQQKKTELHRGYVTTGTLLAAFSNPDHPVTPIISLEEIPTALADCYRLAHEVAMVLLFLHRCFGLPHTEQLSLEDRALVVRAIERLWRCVVQLRPAFNKCQSTLLMVGANRTVSPCAHITVYMSASHFIQEVTQASEQIGYTSVSEALSEEGEQEQLPFSSELIVTKWPEVVQSLRGNITIRDGYRLLSEAYDDLAGEVVRAARYEKGLPIVPVWMRMPEEP